MVCGEGGNCEGTRLLESPASQRPETTHANTMALGIETINVCDLRNSVGLGLNDDEEALQRMLTFVVRILERNGVRVFVVDKNQHSASSQSISDRD